MTYPVEEKKRGNTISEGSTPSGDFAKAGRDDMASAPVLKRGLTVSPGSEGNSTARGGRPDGMGQPGGRGTRPIEDPNLSTRRIKDGQNLNHNAG